MSSDSIDKLTGTEFQPTQRAIQPLEHGRLVMETDNSNVIRLRRSGVDPETGFEDLPIIEFAGAGVATLQFQLIFQPTEDSFPCLVSNPRFALRVFWDEESTSFLAVPVNAGACNRSMRWIVEGVTALNALHDFWRGQDDSVRHPESTVPEKSGELANKLAEVLGTFVGAVGGAFLRGSS